MADKRPIVALAEAHIFHGESEALGRHIIRQALSEDPYLRKQVRECADEEVFSATYTFRITGVTAWVARQILHEMEEDA